MRSSSAFWLSFLLTLFMVGSHASAQSTSPFYTPTTVACPADELVRDTGTPELGNQTLHKACLSLAHACCCSRRVLTSAPPGRSSICEVQKGSRPPSPLALERSKGSLNQFIMATSRKTPPRSHFPCREETSGRHSSSLEVFDVRNSASVQIGLGGLLQSSTYMSALSG